jgi:hypothetical protein
MTRDEAFSNLDRAVASMALDRQSHIALIESLRVLSEIPPAPVETPLVKKPDTTKVTN